MTKKAANHAHISRRKLEAAISLILAKYSSDWAADWSKAEEDKIEEADYEIYNAMFESLEHLKAVTSEFSAKGFV